MLPTPVPTLTGTGSGPRPTGPHIVACPTSGHDRAKRVPLCTLIALLLLCCLSGCYQIPSWSLGSHPPRAWVEAGLPNLLEQVARARVYRPGNESNVLRPQDTAFEPTVGEALRIAMASRVRFYCAPDEEGILQQVGTGAGIVLDFESPQDVPTSSPLPGWFGPLRGCEEMKQVERLYLIPEHGQWTGVIARSADGNWSCWKSNWETEPLSPLWMRSG